MRASGIPPVCRRPHAARATQTACRTSRWERRLQQWVAAQRGTASSEGRFASGLSRHHPPRPRRTYACTTDESTGGLLLSAAGPGREMGPSGKRSSSELLHLYCSGIGRAVRVAGNCILGSPGSHAEEDGPHPIRLRRQRSLGGLQRRGERFVVAKRRSRTALLLIHLGVTLSGFPVKRTKACGDAASTPKLVADLG